MKAILSMFTDAVHSEKATNATPKKEGGTEHKTTLPVSAATITTTHQPPCWHYVNGMCTRTRCKYLHAGSVQRGFTFTMCNPELPDSKFKLQPPYQDEFIMQTTNNENAVVQVFQQQVRGSEFFDW